MLYLHDALTRLDGADDAGAAVVLERLAAETPMHATVHVLLAQTCERLHRWDDALAAWQTARLLLPDLGLVHEGGLRATRVLAAIQTLRAPVGPSTPVPPEPPSGSGVTPPGSLFPFEMPLASEAAPPSHQRPPAPRGTTVFFDPLTRATHAEPWDSREPTAPPPFFDTEDGTPPSGRAVPAGTDSAGAAPLDDLPDVPPHPETSHPGTPRPGSLPTTAPDAARPGGPSMPGVPDTFDLDDLIESLNTAGRIVPRADVDAVPPPPGLDADEADEVVSPTLARIFAAQGQIADAIRAFERLAASDPARAAEFQAEADALRRRLS